MGKTSQSTDDGRVGFALGGLAGNNAHGAGFLAAALANQLEPVSISCTSGQIYWVYEYLKAKKTPAEAGTCFRRAVETFLRNCDPCFQKDLNLWVLSMMGIPNVLEVCKTRAAWDAYANLWNAWLEESSKSFVWPLSVKGWFDSDEKPFWTKAFMNMLPARTLNSLRDRSFFQDVADAFNSEETIKIYFNAYDVKSGTEIVYYNRAAEDKVKDKTSMRPWVRYAPIDSDAVESAMRLYEYGFQDFNRDKKACHFIDGAYIRNIMLAEPADSADIIYVARPIAGAKNTDYRYPESWIEREDLKTEVNFNGTYALEWQKIEMGNTFAKLEADKNSAEKNPKTYHLVKIKEIPFRFERGYFDYIFESRSVFEQAQRDTHDYCIPCTMDCMKARTYSLCEAWKAPDINGTDIDSGFFRTTVDPIVDQAQRKALENVE